VSSADLVVGLSAGQKTGLALVAGIFILFAVLVAYVVPSRWPDFPGEAGLRPFIAATAALFVAMMLAVFFLAREKEEEAEARETPAAGRTVEVREVDYEIELPSTTLEPGDHTFALRNDGEDRHNLVVNGPGVTDKGTPTIGPGKTARLEVRLRPGTYELYCSVPGHRERGMSVKLRIRSPA
jgi:uncharacterized cupredoxin-like copper-binding protein